MTPKEKEDYIRKLTRKEDVERTVISQNWKLASFVIGFSIAILAFGIQLLMSMRDVLVFEQMLILLISFILLVIAFISGMGRLYYSHKELNICYQYNADLLKPENFDRENELLEEVNEMRKKPGWKSSVCSYVMSISFVGGIFAYTLFLFTYLLKQLCYSVY